MEGVSSIPAIQENSPIQERTVLPPSSEKPAPVVPEDAAYVKVSGQVGAKNSDSAATSQPSKSSEQPAASTKEKEASSNELTAEERAEVERLRKRDAEVRAHEQAHLAALGSYRRGGASFTYETGPDGKRYAVGGEVPVDTSPEKTPQQTLQKAQVIKRAALAPATPSSADRAVAAQAAQMAAQAQAEIARESLSTAQGEKSAQTQSSAASEIQTTKRTTTEPIPENTEEIRAREKSVDNWNNIAPPGEATLSSGSCCSKHAGGSAMSCKFCTYEGVQNQLPSRPSGTIAL